MLAVLVAALLAALIVINVAYMLVNDRRDQRWNDQLDRERDERQGLLQRIQAPEIAVVEHAQRNADPDPDPYPKTEFEQAADQGVTQAMIAQIERMQAEGFDMHMPQG